MAEKQKKTDILLSVEIDAAPSVDFVNLASLDIGSECTVETDPKHEIKKIISNTDDVQEEDETEPSSQTDDENTSVEETSDKNGQGTTRDLASGVGSLNLEVSLNQEVTATDNEQLGQFLYHQDSDGDTLLHIAVLHIAVMIDLSLKDLAFRVIELMVEMELSLNVSNHLQQTALHLATLTGQADVVRCLLRAGASPFSRDNELRTPIFIACEQNDMSMLKDMIQNVDWNRRDHGVTSKLLDPSIHALNLPNADGERCLHLAVKYNNVAMAKVLIENGADPNLPDRKSGRTPLHVTADLGHVEMTKYLISVENIDINQITYNRETSLEIAHYRERQEVVALLKPLSFPVKKR